MGIENQQNIDLLKQMLGSIEDPVSQEVAKEAIKFKKKQAVEAMEQGVPPENILEQIGIKKKPASSPFGFGGAKMEGGEIVQQQPGILGALLSTLATGRPDTSIDIDLSRLNKAQQLSPEQQTKGVYGFDPVKGSVSQIGEIPQDAELRSLTGGTTLSEMGGIPEGLEISGLDAFGRPKFRKKQLTMEEKESIKMQSKQKQDQRDIDVNFNTTIGEFKQLIAQLKGGIEEGGAGGLLKGTYGKINTKLKNPNFSRTASISGQRKETSLVFNRILTGQNRVIQGVVEMIGETLPDEFDPPEVISSKTAQSISNAFRIKSAFSKAGFTADVLKTMPQEALNALPIKSMIRNIELTPEENQELEFILQDVLSTPATIPRTLGGTSNTDGLSDDDAFKLFQQQMGVK